MKEKYDLAVIGAGPGGYFAALRAVELNAQVALIEKGDFGGTCLNLGCIPTKTLYQASQDFLTYLEYVRLLNNPATIDSNLYRKAFDQALKEKDKVISALRKQLEGLVSCSPISVYRGSAHLDTRNKITVDGHLSIFANTILLATGSNPIMPASFDLDRTKIMTSNEITDVKELPKSILIIGGGYIGCEYATIFASYGVTVTLVEALGNILSTEDDDVVNEVLRSFKTKGIQVHLSTSLESVQIKGEKVHSHLSNAQGLETDLVLMAIGRSPNVRGLGLDSLGVKLNEKGSIEVDEMLQTTRSDIYAIGDVIDRELRLAHVSEKEGLSGIDAILKDTQYESVNYAVTPTAIFVEPEVASVGMREFQLKGTNKNYVIGKSSYEHNAMAQCSGHTTGFVKLIVDKTSHKLLGASIVGNHASDLIGIVATAMNTEATIETLFNSLWFHPSRPESIKAAAGVALKKLNR
jgi:dihydrolipoamide dehydrogenase